MRKSGKAIAAHRAVQTGSAFMMAPMVAMMRLPILAEEASRQTPWRGETGRAVAEKALATVDGIFAAQMSMVGSMASFWPEVMAGRTPSMLNGVAVERSIQAALRPAGRTVRANFRRLSAKG
jgi:hypothetical protein